MTPAQTEILLVDDNPADAELTQYAFREAGLTNRIHVVQDGEEALDFLFGRGRFAARLVPAVPGLILLDIKLPKVDGLEVLRRLKADVRTRAIPVVVLTSSKQERDLVAGYRLGANSYVQKPVEFAQFRERIRQLGLYWLQLNEPPPVSVLAQGS